MTNETAHTPAPWVVKMRLNSHDERIWELFVDTDEGRIIASFGGDNVVWLAESPEFNARRAAACVKVCEGLSLEWLEEAPLGILAGKVRSPYGRGR